MTMTIGSDAMILSFILGWIAGVIGTLWFGRWMMEMVEQDDERAE